jgi:hypothetical protein
MTNEQARKLLGGYATNSLTEAERKALFEAALDDQELFDALQQEEALKELLADPVSRNQIQEALADAPVSRAAGAAWWSRWWVWGGVAGAAAAAVLIIAVIRSNEQQKYQVARVAPTPQMSAQNSKPAITTPAEPKLQQPEPAPRKARRAARPLGEPSNSTTTGAVSNTLAVQPQAASAPPPPSPPQPAPAAAPQVQAFRQEQFARDGERPQDTKAPVAGYAGARLVANFKAPLLQYSLVKRDPTGAFLALPTGVAPQPGDAVRLAVSPAVPGYLSLSQLDPAGNWKRLFPVADPGLFVAPNASQTIPDSPIIVNGMEQKFRLTLVPVDSKENAAQTKTAAAPLTVDVTIGPAGKLP